MNIGVIVGRFQTPVLHDGHKDIINQVNNLSDKVVILLGCSSAKITRKDPLDFATRRLMVQAHIPDSEIFPVNDNKSNEVWSQNLDNFIKSIHPFDKVTLYGCRDSFIAKYSGKIPVVELTAKNPAHNATELRATAAAEPLNDTDFRKGCIYEAYNRYPISYQAVDMAIIHDGKVLLGRKAQQTGWRFPGGFVDATDDSLEFAAKRETSEEVPGMEVDNFQYLTSRRIKDWRYNGREDQIMSAFFKCQYIFGPTKAGDDLVEVKWFDLDLFINHGHSEDEEAMKMLVDEHVHLMKYLVKNL